MDIYRKRMEQFSDAVTVYPVSCEKLAGGRSDRQWLDSVLAGGAKIVQLRDKVSKDNVLLEKAHYFREQTRAAGALFVVNDRVDIALMADADGVHVGREDLPPDQIRAIAPRLIIGVSCNSREDVLEVARRGSREDNPVSYFNIGPLFSTETKEGLRQFLGLDAVRQFSSLCNLPFTVMGGIKENHIEELVKLGAKRIAVVTAISQAIDIKEETAKWMRRITTSGSS